MYYKRFHHPHPFWNVFLQIDFEGIKMKEVIKLK